MLNEAAAAALGCPVEGNPDLYGLGIRVGIYLQMLTVQLSGLLSTAFRLEDHIGQGTIVFVLAAVVVLVRLLSMTINPGPDGSGAGKGIEPVEVFPVLTLLLIQVGVCRVSSENKTTMLIWMAELVGLAALFLWFWWRGMDLLPRSCPDDKAFFFAQVSIYNWFRTFNKVSSVVTAVAVAIAVVSASASVLYHCVVAAVRHLRNKRDDDEGAAENVDAETRRYKPVVGAFDLVANVGAIVFVEMSLKWNNISGVHSLNSPGQFMPFFVALGQLLTVFYSAIKHGLRAYAEERIVVEHGEKSGR
ncbi:hypothetical protein DCS_06732 [Drechmeria coniospora]|uniref:Uncharacterized protein n=1 Tax=Drechmeria coniospora TaxID=98403 RepID=A0A151GCD6_DRECN|nr:hypothetical protein DCS_06732 [Drechmeria coniospora]KYK54772.1 hypothetical protein DCS_06732 [Drechmeria coniospora]